MLVQANRRIENRGDGRRRWKVRLGRQQEFARTQADGSRIRFGLFSHQVMITRVSTFEQLTEAESGRGNGVGKPWECQSRWTQRGGILLNTTILSPTRVRVSSAELRRVGVVVYIV